MGFRRSEKRLQQTLQGETGGASRDRTDDLVVANSQT